MVLVEKFLFFLFIFFLPTQFGKHFWPSFSTVLGLRVDYLSPTLYITDILFILIFISMGESVKEIIGQIIKNKKLLLFLFLIFVTAVFSSHPLLALYGFIRFVQCVFLVYYILNRNFLYLAKNLRDIFAGVIIFQSFLAVLQFIKQGSIGGIWYFFGERMFTSLTPGIATISINGEKILRSYSTLPHPNVLAGYMLISLLLLIFFAMKGKTSRLFFLCMSFLSFLTILITFSRSALFAIVVISFITGIFIFSKQKNNKSAVLFLITAFIVGILLALWTQGLFGSESFLVRYELLVYGLDVIQKNPVFGVGLFNFIPALGLIVKASKNVFFLQPVHNIYILAVVETGVVGAIFIAGGVFKIVKKLSHKITIQTFPLFLGILAVFIIGFFDHYFYTILQGRLIVAFLIGTIMACDNKEGKTV